MKYLVSFSISVLAAFMVLSVMPVYGEAEIYNDVLRLHVIAESDSPSDQALKLKVRDAVLECIGKEIGDCKTVYEALSAVHGMKDEITESAERCIQENGEDCTVKVELGKERYPRREYDGATLPSGVYSSLRVTLGEGDGKNWWCVLFPTLCMGFAKAEADEGEHIAVGFTPREYRMITGQSGGVKIRFRILEILSEVIGFEY